MKSRLMQWLCSVAIPSAAVSILFCLGVEASAQETGQPSPPQESETWADDWDLALGGGVAYVPDYLGSDNYEVGFFPLVEVSYRDLVFLDGPSLGVNLLSVTDGKTGNRLRIGPLVRYEGGREDDDNRALEGLGDVDDSVEVGGFLDYRLGPWSAGLTIVQDVADGHDGLRAEFETAYELGLAESLGLRLAAATSWADADYMESYFGVNAAQSAASGLRQFDADAGFRDVGVSVGVRYEMFEDWFLGARAAYLRLLGDAADSPIVDDEGSADQLFVGSSVFYRF